MHIPKRVVLFSGLAAVALSMASCDRIEHCLSLNTEEKVEHCFEKLLHKYEHTKPPKPPKSTALEAGPTTKSTPLAEEKALKEPKAEKADHAAAAPSLDTQTTRRTDSQVFVSDSSGSTSTSVSSDGSQSVDPERDDPPDQGGRSEPSKPREPKKHDKSG